MRKICQKVHFLPSVLRIFFSYLKVNLSILKAMEIVEFSWQELLDKVTEKVLYLEAITEEISRDLAIQRAIREEWCNWNEDWKSAWLFTEDEKKRLATSVTLRLSHEKNSFPNS